MKKNRQITAGILSLFMTICLTFMMIMPAQAADTSALEYEQTEARSMLSIINSFRTGSDAWYWNSDNTTKTNLSGKLKELTYDYNLEKVAMQRAAEIAVYYSHTRPNGDKWTSAYTGTYYSKGENIGRGYSSAEEVFAKWQEANENYNNQKHRRIMLSSKYTSIGIACVKYNGVKYWVQEFGNPNPGSSKTTADVKKGSVYTVSSVSYKVTNSATNGIGTVTCTGIKSKSSVSSVNVPAAVTINGKNFRVTAIGSKAFSGCKKLKSVTIGSNVTTIGAKAFYGDKALKKIMIKSKKLKKIGKQAIKGIHKKAVIKVPSSKVKAYKRLFKNKTGFKKTMKLKK